jgi:hypothetical protein
MPQITVSINDQFRSFLNYSAYYVRFMSMTFFAFAFLVLLAFNEMDTATTHYRMNKCQWIADCNGFHLQLNYSNRIIKTDNRRFVNCDGFYLRSDDYHHPYTCAKPVTLCNSLCYYSFSGILADYEIEPPSLIIRYFSITGTLVSIITGCMILIRFKCGYY